MAKKRKVSSRPTAEGPPAGWNEQGGKLGAINSYEDVADSEDEFHINRDKIMLEDEPDAKRRRKWQEEGMIVPILFVIKHQLTSVQTRYLNHPTRRY